MHGLCKALVALVARGHEVHVFTTNIDGPGNSPVPIGVPVNLESVRVRYFPCPLLRRLYWAPALGCALEREIGKFDKVHLSFSFPVADVGGSPCRAQGWRSLRSLAQGYADQGFDRSAQLACQIRLDPDYREIQR
jgi:hypothetical protein